MCGAPLVWDAAARALACAHCGETRAPDAIAPGGASPERSARCGDCGADVSFPGRTVATVCSFCGSAHVLDLGQHDAPALPELLAPFSVDAAAARAAFARWIRRRWLSPSSLRRLATVEAMSGLYVPYFRFDARARSRWSAERGHQSTVEEPADEPRARLPIGPRGPHRRSRRKTTHTRWERAFGTREDHYTDIEVCASRGLPTALTRRLRPLDEATLCPYAPGYLAGFGAESFAIDRASARAEVEADVRDAQIGRCAADVGGDVQRGLSVESQVTTERERNLLRPLWVAAYHYRGRLHQFLVDGANPKVVVGRAPASWLRVAALVALIAALSVALFLLLRDLPSG
jgi:DNA-directed RNA polymerase subunit RPC12/RpoP